MSTTECVRTIGKITQPGGARSPIVSACEEACLRVERFTVKRSVHGEVSIDAPNVTVTNVSEVHAESKGGCVTHRFKEFASEFKWVMVALKDAHCQHLPTEMAKTRRGVSKTRAQQQRTSSAKERALEQVFNHCLATVGKSTLAHADLADDKVCDEFEVW
jgi:hypothetical protein